MILSGVLRVQRTPTVRNSPCYDPTPSGARMGLRGTPKMKKLVPMFVLLVLLGVPSSRAGDRIGIGIKAGTLGFGLDLTGRVNDWFSLRGTYSQYDYKKTFEESGNDYDGTLKLGAYGVLADFFPAKGNFRISIGYFKNRNEIDLFSTPTAPVEIGNTIYPAAAVGTLTGDVVFNTYAPYFGIGYGSAARPGARVRFVFDIGVMSQGAGDASLSSSTGLVSPADLAIEEADIENEIDSYKLWPVIAFGISFRI